METLASSLSDYPVLKKLAAALWQQDNTFQGAAVMVGAGFSRSAASNGDVNCRLPLWNDFSKTIAKELCSNINDPLRLAEEYCAYFGKQTLHDLIKKEVNDSSWEPGELHKSLLELPWSEILTTNWDTLLERASKDVHQPVYSLVSKQEDLASARSPRIVKLHGTINVTEDLVFTQEDYRKYPQRYAAFVNFARQVFIENELCLLGFSGDDPNFLQWAGWVRDHLATNSRRIYLVGALSLNSAKRKYLESINIAPIDLADLVAAYDDYNTKHTIATTIFIQELQKLKPKQSWEWTPAQQHPTELSTFEADRMSYPGWLVCPPMQRWSLQYQLHELFTLTRTLDKMQQDNREKLLYEIAWRCDITYEVPPLWIAQKLIAICDPAKPCTLTKKQQLEIAVLLMKNSIWHDTKDYDSIEQETISILEKQQKFWPESSNELIYHNALIARDKFDYFSLEKFVKELSTGDATWKLRKSSLLAEIGQFEKSKVLVAEAYQELLEQHRQDRNSIYIFSRLAWAHFFIRGINISSPKRDLKAFPSNYNETKCNPFDCIDNIKSRVIEVLNKQREGKSIQPLFEPGSYKDNSKTITLSNELHPVLLLNGVFNTAGVPLRWSHTNFLVEPATRITELDEIDGELRFALAIRAANSDDSEVLKNVFSRIEVACISRQEVEFLLNQCKQAINFWIIKKNSEKNDTVAYAIERLRVFIEILARVSVRATPEEAKDLFRWGIAFGKKSELRHFGLFEPLQNLLNFTLKAIPVQQHHELLIEALSFPLESEIGLKDNDKWPNPIIEQPGSRNLNAALDRRIDAIIDSIGPCSPQSAHALLRLLPLIKNNFLTEIENAKIATQIWSDSPNYQKIPNTGLLSYVLLYLPAQDHSKVEMLIRSYLFENAGDDLFKQEILMDIATAATAENIKIFPSTSQASDYFGRLVSWTGRTDANDILGFIAQKNKLTAKLISEALVNSIAPVLPPEVLNQDNFQKLFDFYSRIEEPRLLTLFVYFAVANEEFVERVEKLIRQSLQTKESNTLACASYALLNWRKMKKSAIIDKLILRLVYLIGLNNIVSLPALLWTANEMYSNGYLHNSEIESLSEIIPIIFDTLDYNNIATSSKESVNASLTRKACVKFARTLTKSNQYNNDELLRILDEAKHDALPEVRMS